MSEQERDKVRALVPVDERRVTLMEGDEVRAVRAEDGTIYLPVLATCRIVIVWMRHVASTGMTRASRYRWAGWAGLRHLKGDARFPSDSR